MEEKISKEPSKWTREYRREYLREYSKRAKARGIRRVTITLLPDEVPIVLSEVMRTGKTMSDVVRTMIREYGRKAK